MAKRSISQIVASAARPIVEEAGCELVDVEYVKEGSNWFVRVYIDKPEGITLDDCEKISRPLNKKLDEMDPIPHAFYLEVSSPGLDRPLKKPGDFEKAVGSLVEVRLYKPVDNTKHFEGELFFYDGESIGIKAENGESRQFRLEQVAKVNRAVKF